jgi:hypothetical protein
MNLPAQLRPYPSLETFKAWKEPESIPDIWDWMQLLKLTPTVKLWQLVGLDNFLAGFAKRELLERGLIN